MNSAKRTVFVVDDDPAICDSMKELLAAAGFKPETFCSAQEFLDSLRSVAEGCVVLDIRLPDMDGFEVLERLKGLGLDIPVILITGHSHLADRARADHAGAFALLQKPVTDGKLIATIESASGSTPCAPCTPEVVSTLNPFR